MKIKHLLNNEIDRQKWDNCIKESFNELVYAYSWYLDIVSPEWEALVSEDYEYIMPLPVKRRYKIPYIVQPVLTQQLGIFSSEGINETIVLEFIKSIPHYSYEINLNEFNYCHKTYIYPNFLLDLRESYDKISTSYSKNTLRNIEKAKKQKLIIQSNLTIDEFIEFNSSVEKKFSHPQPELLKAIITKGQSNNSISLYGVVSAEKRLIAALCLLHSTHRITYLLPISNEEGKSTSAMFFLIDSIIRNEAGSKKVFDFEGSAIPGIARFYKGFGAKKHSYYIIKRFRPSILISK